ncbi:MAG: amidohydrolase [Pseudomonadota bacterium]
MKKAILFALCLFVTLSLKAADIKQHIRKISPTIEALYKDLHKHPEIAFQEIGTSKRFAKELKALGFKVTEKVGGTGVVGVFRNGQGPTAWLRSEMDGLEIEEKTDWNFKSASPGIMHGCGHDLHMASLIGTVSTLISMKDQWKGTLVVLGQPAEETLGGAKAMIKDGLFKRFPKPDYLLAFHNTGSFEAGQIAYREGQAYASLDSVDIIVHGVGGHGSAPHGAVDPIVLAGKMIVGMQTLISRNVPQTEPAVFSFGSVQGGKVHNVIPDKVHLKGTIRSFKPEVQQVIKKGIVRQAKKLAEAEGAPPPQVIFSQTNTSVFNDPEIAAELTPVFKKIVGSKNVIRRNPILASEDFAQYPLAIRRPAFMFWIGVRPAKPGKNWGSNHNPYFAPDYKKTLPIAMESLVSAVLHLQKTKTSTTH